MKNKNNDNKEKNNKKIKKILLVIIILNIFIIIGICLLYFLNTLPELSNKIVETVIFYKISKVIVTILLIFSLIFAIYLEYRDKNNSNK